MKAKEFMEVMRLKPLTEGEKEVCDNIGEWDYFYVDVANKKAWTEDGDGNFLVELNFQNTQNLLGKRGFFDIIHSNLSVIKYEMRTISKRLKRDEENPMPQEEIESTLQCLYRVGKTKALGNLSIYMLTKRCGVSLEEIHTFAEKNGLQIMLFPNPELRIHLGTIYIYHENMLQTILEEEQESLQEANVPFTSTEAYIQHINQNRIFSGDYPNTYRAIGRTFNDERFRK